MRDVGLPLRAALTGTKTAPSILDIVRVLGTKEPNRINQICLETHIQRIVRPISKHYGRED